jgi:hypothetical protein
MGIFTRDQFANEDESAGVFLSSLGTALVTWRAMQDKGVITVADAALDFNTTPAIIIEAISGSMWIDVDNTRSDDPRQQLIELDGE